MTDMLKAYNPDAEVVKVRLLSEHGHFQGNQYPAGTECRACWDADRSLWDVELPDGHLIRMTNGAYGAERIS